MDCILNECSLNGQYSDLNDFIHHGASNLLPVLDDLVNLDRHLLWKRSDFFQSQVTPKLKFYELVTSPESRTNDNLRIMKSRLARLQNEPYWDEDVKHDVTKDYFRLTDGEEPEIVTFTSVAEARARNACLVSFVPSGYTDPTVIVRIENNTHEVPNVNGKGQLIDVLKAADDIDMPTYFRHKYHTKLNFDKIKQRNGFELLSAENFSLFDDAFRKFEELTWPEVLSDNGFDYKAFSRNRNTNAFFLPEEWDKNIHKFRISQEIRCFGYVINEVFYLLRIDLDHHLSDLG